MKFLRKILTLSLAAALALSAVPALAAGAGLDNFCYSRDYPAGLFTDVGEDRWFAGSVAAAYELGLVSGASETTFEPDGSVTLAEALALACRLHSIYRTGAAGFTQGAPWYQVYVDYAVENGIIAVGAYRDYNAAATRSQFAAILAAALPAEALAAVNTVEDGAIPDVPQGSESYDAVYRLYRAGVLTGNDAAGTFTPGSAIARSEMAALVTRMADPDLRKAITLTLPEEEPAFAVTTPSFSISSSVYDDDIGDLEVGVIKLTDYENGFTDMRYMDFYFSEIVKYTFVSSDPDVIKVNEDGGLYDPVRLEADDDPVTAVITVTRQGGQTAQVLVTVSPRAGWYVVDDEYIAEFAEEATKLVNEYRTEAGVQTVTYVPSAQDFANARSAELVDNFSHTWENPNLADDFGVSISFTSENIARIGLNISGNATMESPEDAAYSIITSLYNSSNHRFTMLIPTHEFMVVGITIDADTQTMYCTQLFNAAE